MVAARRKSITAIPGRSLAAVAAEHHASDLRKYLWRRLDNRHDVDEVAQSVFFKLVRISDDELLVQKPFGFIRTIADRAVSEFDALRSQERERTVSLDEVDRDGGAIHEGGGGDPGDELAAIEQYEAALAQLSTKLAAVLTLVARDGLSYAEVAERMKATEHAVKKNYQRARCQLKRQLTSEEGR